MARLVSEVLGTSRSFLQDTKEPYRYSETDLLSYYNMAISDARRLRPDLFYGEANSPYVPANTADDFALPEMYFLPCVFYVTALGEMRDDEYTSDGRIAFLTARFHAALTTPKA